MSSTRFPVPNPSEPLDVVQIGAPSHDPAIDLDHLEPIRVDDGEPLSLAELLSHYERTRAPVLRDALPVRIGARLRRFTLRPLSPMQYAAVAPTDPRESLTNVSAMATVGFACHRFVNERGESFEAKLVRGAMGPQEHEAWLVRLVAVGGQHLVRELATIAIQRAEVAPEALDPFGLPRGLRLPR